jgi:RNA polymerase sigma-70 factor (ECF subfamily)
MRRFGDADLAEESVQEAFGRAAARWRADGVPGSPLGWIVATAGNVAVDRLRRERALRERLPALAAEPRPEPEAFEEDDAVPDERLELIFTCCHPALSAEASVALTLRLVAGLTTAEIARAFLVPEVAMAQRLVRAKAKIRMAGIPFGRPPGHLLGDRLEHTAAVLYLVFNEGYSASSGDDLVRRDLCDESIRLARLLVSQLPAEPEARGLLALMLLHHARSAARTTAGGEMVLLEHQDRGRWDTAMIRSGSAELRRAQRAGAPGPYQLQAAIAELHVRAVSFEATDWEQVSALYADLARSPRRPWSI